MKRSILSLFIILCTLYHSSAQVFYSTSNAAAQRPAKTLDLSAIQVIYQASSLPDSSAIDRVAKDTMILQIGQNRISKYFADTRMRDSIMRARMAQMQSQVAAGGGVTVQSFGSMRTGSASSSGQTVIYKNGQTGIITVTDRIMMDSYCYTEPANEIVWQILPDTDTVITYLCQKATTTFRGRDYEAWFASDIPINEGPWKFHGLPGLILRVRDTQHHYLFECIGLEHSQAPIEYADLDYLKTNRKDYARIARRYHEDPMSAMDNLRAAAAPSMPTGGNTQTIRVVRSADGTTLDENEMRNRLRNRAYNPIELDY
jgi:GLPGLI family protein